VLTLNTLSAETYRMPLQLPTVSLVTVYGIQACKGITN